MVCDAVALDGLEALEIQQALRVLVTGRVTIKTGLDVCQSCVHNGWVILVTVLYDFDQLRAVQCGAGQLVCQDEVEAFLKAAVPQDAAVQKAGQGGLCVCVCLGLLSDAVPQLLLGQVVGHGAPSLTRVVIWE